MQLHNSTHIHVTFFFSFCFKKKILEKAIKTNAVLIIGSPRSSVRRKISREIRYVEFSHWLRVKCDRHAFFRPTRGRWHPSYMEIKHMERYI